MPINVPKNEEKKDFKSVPEGVHVARCYSLVDVGTQDKEWQGEPKLTREIRLTWEIPGERIEWEKDGEKKDAPMSIGNFYTLSFGEKANLRKMFKSWIPDFDPESEVFDEALVLGRPALITVNHVTKGEKTYANIVAVTPLVKGMECPPQENPNVFFTVDNFNGYDALPDWLKKKVEASHEYRARQSDGHLTEGDRRYAEVSKDAPNPDEIPF